MSLNPQNQIIVNKIFDFILKENYRHDLPEEILKEYITKHLEYGTIFILWDDNNECCAVARWNWVNEDTIKILDLLIRKDMRGKPSLMKRMLAYGLTKNPACKHITFDREFKYPNRGLRQYDTKEFL